MVGCQITNLRFSSTAHESRDGRPRSSLLPASSESTCANTRASRMNESPWSVFSADLGSGLHLRQASGSDPRRPCQVEGAGKQSQGCVRERCCNPKKTRTVSSNQETSYGGNQRKNRTCSQPKDSDRAADRRYGTDALQRYVDRNVREFVDSVVSEFVHGYRHETEQDNDADTSGKRRLHVQPL